MKDFLIVGQGVAGSFLAWELIRRGKSVMVVDDSHHQSSSVMSAGIINPVTGKRFVATPGFDQFYAYARQTYRELEYLFGETYFVEKPVLRFFKDVHELSEWQAKVTDVDGPRSSPASQYVKSFSPPKTYAPLLEDPFGSILITHSGLCDTSRLLGAFKEYFLKTAAFTIGKLSYADLRLESRGAYYREDYFKKVIFCEGYQAQFNPWFQRLPYNSVKGELLRVKFEHAPWPDAVINKGKWCAPLADQTWACGATYEWDDLNCEPTQQGRQEILQGIRTCLGREDGVIVNHQAAVRPVMKDQRPVLGPHPQTAALGIFNGLGSKGFLMAPYYARQFAEFLTGRGRLDTDVSISRF
jgi:glycine/D-amino acid oxidase-like deaminating enzyme